MCHASRTAPFADKNSLQRPLLSLLYCRPRLGRTYHRPARRAAAVTQSTQPRNHPASEKQPMIHADIRPAVSRILPRALLVLLTAALLVAAPAALHALPLCSPGSWSATGKQPCTLASPGYYVSGSGAKSQTPAPLGRYVPNAGGTQALLAPKGYYVPTTAATHTTPASPGYYVAVTGASSQTRAGPGYYVPGSAATAPTPAPLGYFVAGYAATVPTVAPVGTYVGSIAATKALSAPAGYYAPNAGMSAPIAAGLGFFVPKDRLGYEFPAFPGFYVGTTASTTQTHCPLFTSSYGQAPACRYVGGTSTPVPGSIGPSFFASFVPGSQIDVGSFAGGSTVTLHAWIQNASASLQQLLGTAPTNPRVLALTQLTLLGTTIGAVPQVHTSILGLPDFTVLGEGA